MKRLILVVMFLALMTLPLLAQEAGKIDIDLGMIDEILMVGVGGMSVRRS